MSWGGYAILIIFGAFVLLLIISPNLSCFGKRVRSPFYPLRRKKQQMKAKVTDYQFDLGGEKTGKDGEAAEIKKTDQKTDDYGFRLH
jgi:hypothetical protein